MVSKRCIDEHIRTTIGGKWATFDQMQMVEFKFLDSDIIHTDLETMQRSKYSFASNKYKEQSTQNKVVEGKDKNSPKVIGVQVGNTAETINTPQRKNNSGYRTVKLKVETIQNKVSVK